MSISSPSRDLRKVSEGIEAEMTRIPRTSLDKDSYCTVRDAPSLLTGQTIPSDLASFAFGTFGEEEKEKNESRRRKDGSRFFNRYGWKGGSDDKSFMDLSYRIARNSYCVEGNMGCVIVKDTSRIVAVTVNTALSTPWHSECHAEANAVAACAARGVSMKGTCCYVTKAPCKACFRLLCMAGVSRIVCPQTIGETMRDTATRIGIEWVSIRDTKEEERARDAHAACFEDKERVRFMRKERKRVRTMEKRQKRQRKEERRAIAERAAKRNAVSSNAT